jgi:isopenicillin-N epimerase
MHSLFARDPDLCFLNAGTLSRVPLSVMTAMEKVRREEELNPTKAVFLSAAHFWKAQADLAPFFGADPKDLFFRSNITAALNDFFFALEQIGSGEFVATGFEYGATMNLARVRAAQLGLGFRVLPMPIGPQVSAAELEEAVVAGFGPQTKVLVLSHVATALGAVFPVGAIAKKARERGILTVVDGAHAVGALLLNLRDLDVDFYGGNLHKWFMAPKGTAFGWVNPRIQSRLEWKFGGWASFELPSHYQGFEGGQEAARRLFQGTMDTAPFQALPLVKEFWLEHGPDRLRALLASRQELCARLAEEEGWDRVSPREPGALGPLVSFRIPPTWPQLAPGELAAKIYHEKKVQLAIPQVQGESVVRLSPGIYSTEEEIHRAFERLRSL